MSDDKEIRASMKYLTCREAGVVLNLSEASVRVRAHRGELPYYQLPRGCRFIESDLLEYLAVRKIRSDFKKKCGLVAYIEEMVSTIIVIKEKK